MVEDSRRMKATMAVPIKGLGDRVSFRLESKPPDGTAAASVRVPPSGDLGAASVLERLCVPLRGRGFLFSQSEAGHGGRARTACEVSGVRISMGLSQEETLYELKITAAQRGSRTLRFFRTSDALPSRPQQTLWDQFCTLVNGELVQSLGATGITWRVGHFH
jgi:hypothetical protein